MINFNLLQNNVSLAFDEYSTIKRTYSYMHTEVKLIKSKFEVSHSLKSQCP